MLNIALAFLELLNPLPKNKINKIIKTREGKKKQAIIVILVKLAA